MNKLLIILLLSSPVLADNSIDNIPQPELETVEHVVVIDGRVVKVYVTTIK